MLFDSGYNVIEYLKGIIVSLFVFQLPQKHSNWHICFFYSLYNYPFKTNGALS